MVFPQIDSGQAEIKRANIEFENGNHLKVIEIAKASADKARKNKNRFLISEALYLQASSEISLQRYDDATRTLDAAFEVISEDKTAANQKALIYMHYAWLFRAQHKFSDSLAYSRKAVAVAPENRYILAAHFLNTGRSLFASGYDISAIVWLEKAEKLLETENVSSVKLDTYRFLSLAWLSKLNYQTSLKYAEKCALLAEKSQFKYKYRQALLDLQNILSDSGQEKRALEILKKGLKLSETENDFYLASIFLSSLVLQLLDIGDVAQAFGYINELEKLDEKKQFTFEVKLGKAITAAFQNQPELSERIFAEIDKEEKPSDYPPLYWKITIAEKNHNWEKLIKINQDLLDLTVKDNFRSGLPKIYLNFAKAYFNLNQLDKSAEYLQKSLALIEEIRKSENYNLSLGLSETYHNSYRLLAQIKSENPQESFELADFLKARLLKDRINNTAAKSAIIISPAIRQQLEEISIKFIDNQILAGEIEKIENLAFKINPDLNLDKPNLTELDQISDLNDAAIISYFFTLDNKLLAFVKEKGRPLQTIYLPLTEDEIESSAIDTQQKIKNLIFFKRDGKALFDKLLKPLNLSAKHLIIIPDKSLWKIPFQALSADGEKYLIEEKLISYAPSVSILLEQLKGAKPNRQTLQSFANSSFENKLLQYVNAEASTVAGIYNGKPIINAAVGDFSRVSDKFDILHFSMHAEVVNDQPLDSFLGFKKIGSDKGRLTVEELLNINLKKGSLVFLASCDTNNILSGEGLVSLAWGMMGSGATTVISSQWEANDKSTAIFTKTFYEHYIQGISSAEAFQKASLELIKNKSGNMHEPYFWADFALNGDYR